MRYFTLNQIFTLRKKKKIILPVNNLEGKTMLSTKLLFDQFLLYKQC